jgi:S1-C subfamily serine protease
MRIAWAVVTLAMAMNWESSARCADSTPSPPAKTVALARLVVKLPPGTQWAILQKGMFCTAGGAITANGGQSEMKVAAVMDAFRSEFKAAGLHPEEEASLFDPAGASPSEYALAGVITDQKFVLCAPDASPTGVNKMKGDASMTIDWQLYSRLEKQVVARVHTTGSFSSREIVTGGAPMFENKVFSENVKQLAADPALRKVLSGAGLSEGDLVKPPAQSQQVVTGALAVRPRPIDKAGQSVVVIYAGNTLGSGVLISQDGFVLTDAHVVGDSPAVRLRWTDGKDSTATVVRVSKERDVALLKTDVKGHDALPLRQTTPEIGATVFAVGAPEGQRFEGTVTRGVISASRVFQGFTYIQSDVTTGHGASGGPLLDENGYVVGLTEGGTHNQTSSGISLFTPVKDAIAFLALDLR